MSPETLQAMMSLLPRNLFPNCVTNQTLYLKIGKINDVTMDADETYDTEVRQTTQGTISSNSETAMDVCKDDSVQTSDTKVTTRKRKTVSKNVVPVRRSVRQMKHQQ